MSDNMQHTNDTEEFDLASYLADLDAWEDYIDSEYSSDSMEDVDYD